VPYDGRFYFFQCRCALVPATLVENEVISLTRLGLLTWRLKRKVVFNSEVWKTTLNLDDQPNVVDFLSAVSTAYNIEIRVQMWDVVVAREK
jgi:hypothetical protein